MGKRMQLSFRSSLVRHLAVVLLLKAIVLYALWRVFVVPQEKEINAQSMAGHIAASQTSQSPMEVHYDDRSNRH